MPDAQMTGTACDYHKFHVALANHGKGANGYQLLSPVSVKLLMANSLPGGVSTADIAAPFAAFFATPTMGYGLGGFCTRSVPGGPTLQSVGSCALFTQHC